MPALEAHMPGDGPPVLDTRAEADFLAGHLPGAASIPLEELAARAHELPPKGAAIAIFDADPGRLARAADALAARGYAVTPTKPRGALARALTETGPARVRLWRPSPLVAEAIALVAAEACSSAADVRRALDLACGSGRDAVALALAGYEVDAVDVLPDALERARDLAARSSVTVRTALQDLKREPRLPEARYDVAVMVRFLHRPLLAALGRSVAPGGLAVCEVFHRADAPPGRTPLGTDHTVADGELAAFFPGFEPLIARDRVARGGRVFAQLIARRPAR
jgi:SAM-dependent methyltransferase